MSAGVTSYYPIFNETAPISKKGCFKDSESCAKMNCGSKDAVSKNGEYLAMLITRSHLVFLR